MPGRIARLAVMAWLLVWSDGAYSESSASIRPSTDLVPAAWIKNESYWDEFDGAALDQQRWQRDVPSWGAWSWNSDLVEIKDGRLRLGMAFRPHSRNGTQLQYEAGIVRSAAPPLLYGYFEARIKAAERWPGVATAFWLFRNTPDYWTEIDVVEMMQRRMSKRVLDYSQYVMRGAGARELPVRVKRKAEVEWDPSAGFHTYAVLWTDREISYFVDGTLLSSERNDYWHSPMDVVLSMAIRSPLDQVPETGGFPTWAEVDYLRVWTPGAE